MIKTLLEGDEDMGKAHVKYVNFTHNSDMRRLYRARLKAHRDAQYRLDMATDQGLAKGLAKGREEGIKKGICDAKRSDLIRLMDLKYGLTANEETFISSISDLESLNSAMDKIIISESKVQVLEVLKKNL